MGDKKVTFDRRVLDPVGDKKVTLHRRVLGPTSIFFLFYFEHVAESDRSRENEAKELIKYLSGDAFEIF